MYWDLDLVMLDIICYQFQIIWDDLVVDIILLQYYIPRKIGKSGPRTVRRSDSDLKSWLYTYKIFLGG